MLPISAKASAALSRRVLQSEDLVHVGLTGPAAVARMDIDDVAMRLARAGYSRGEYMEHKLAERIHQASLRLAHSVT